MPVDEMGFCVGEIGANTRSQPLENDENGMNPFSNFPSSCRYHARISALAGVFMVSSRVAGLGGRSRTPSVSLFDRRLLL